MPKKDKGPLLKRECEVGLINLLVQIPNVSFTDNFRSMRNGTFRLGAWPIKGVPYGVDMTGVVSKAFK